MLWNHSRAMKGDKNEVLPIGRWVNLRVENGKLLGDAEFDSADPFAAEIERKVEAGIINEASSGLKPLKWSNDAAVKLVGQQYPTLAECGIREASITDIASNEFAVALYDDQGQSINLTDENVLVSLTSGAITTPPTDMNELQTLALSLGLPVTATLAEVQAKQNLLLSQNATLTGQLATLQAAETQRRAAEITTLLDAAVTDNRITVATRPAFQKLFDGDFDNAKSILEAMPKTVKLTEFAAKTAGDQGGMTYQGKTFSQLSKESPKVLETLQANDMATFKALYKAEFGKDYKETAK